MPAISAGVSRVGQLSAGSRSFDVSPSNPSQTGGGAGNTLNVNIYAQDSEDVQRSFKKKAYRQGVENATQRRQRRSQ